MDKFEKFSSRQNQQDSVMNGHGDVMCGEGRGEIWGSGWAVSSQMIVVYLLGGSGFSPWTASPFWPHIDEVSALWLWDACSC